MSVLSFLELLYTISMLVIGHRGARGLAPENTLASLQKALEHHADMLEFDLRVTKDGVVILHHDPGLTDGDAITHPIYETSYKELKAHKPDLTTFEEVLRIDKVPFYIEVKPKVAISPIVQLLKGRQDSKRLFLASKSQATLIALHKALPHSPVIVIEPWSGVRAHWRARQLGTKLVSMNQRWLWWGFIRGFKHNGWLLYAYTLNDTGKAKRWEKYGLAGVVTDYPDLFERHP
jgi:glycerophosphoryl diester phosphodiesterase